VADKTLSKDELIEQIKKMSVLDLADLVHALEDEFGVSAAAPVAVAAGPAAAAPRPKPKKSRRASTSSCSPTARRRSRSSRSAKASGDDRRHLADRGLHQKLAVEFGEYRFGEPSKPIEECREKD
jgi:hypothetical protein